ncbi:MAG: sensor domain-containing diguanylate cyclase [Planctomycetaceae bacterium]
MPLSKVMELPATVGLTLGFGALGAWAGPRLGYSAGEMAVLCGLPAAVAATVAGRRTATAATVTLVSVGLVGLCRDLYASVELAGPAVGFAAAIAALVLAGARRHEHEQHLLDLERLNRQMHADAVQRSEPFFQSPSDDEVLGCATSLLSLQEAGRRIATHIDLDTLVPTIVTTARSALKCRYAAVYFWDGSRRSLVASLPPRLRDAGHFVPDPTSGIAQWVIETRHVFAASAVESYPDLPVFATDGGRLPAGVAPLLAGDELLGLLVVDDPDRTDPSFARMLYVLANLAALGIKNAQLFRRVEDASRRDPLTGLLNRGAFEAAGEELTEAAATGMPLTLLLSDLDHFKRLNDEHGHQAGDAVLREAARLWRASLPDDAIIARYGGEEFVALLPDRDLDEAGHLAEDLRAAVALYPFAHAGRLTSITASFGLAAFAATDRDLDAALRRADEQLYRAKAKGRNRVCAGEELVVGG